MKKIFLIFFIFLMLTEAQYIRPIKDKIGFCWTKNEIETIYNFFDNDSSIPNIPKKNLIGGISPHDDYLYAGKEEYALLKNVNVKEVVIFGVTHRRVRMAMDDPQNTLILDSFDNWKGPMGKVYISDLRERIKLHLSDKYFIVSNKAHSLEHSIEALIPFIQKNNPKVKITPIMITKMPFDKMQEISNELSDIICNYIEKKNYTIGKDIMFLISSDANHYGEDFENTIYGDDLNAHKIATAKDKELVNTYLNNEITDEVLFNLTQQIWPLEENNPPLWCGRYPIIMGLLTINRIVEKLLNKKIESRFISYGDTFSNGVIPIKNTSLGITAVFSVKHWVGAFSTAFYIK